MYFACGLLLFGHCFVSGSGESCNEVMLSHVMLQVVFVDLNIHRDDCCSSRPD